MATLALLCCCWVLGRVQASLEDHPPALDGLVRGDPDEELDARVARV